MSSPGARERGFTMIEILVSLLLIVFGLLGMLGLQAQATVAEFESYQRGQALILVQDMADRVGTNRSAAGCYAITTDTAFTFYTTEYAYIAMRCVSIAPSGRPAVRMDKDADKTNGC